MRLTQFLLFTVFIGICLMSLPGCGGRSGEATVAPRSESEIEEYKKQVYAAEEEQEESDMEEEEE